MAVDYNTYEGFQVTGFPDVVLSRGKVIVQDNQYHGRKGHGRFIKRARYNDLLRAERPAVHR
ncbi:D-hydantoinase [compost metagenome]